MTFVIKKRKPNKTNMDNRRKDHRVNLNLMKTIEVQLSNHAQIFDISEGGASFQSDREYEVGSEITLSDGFIRIQAEILECFPLETEAGIGNGIFKNRCRFKTVDNLAGEVFFGEVTRKKLPNSQ